MIDLTKASDPVAADDNPSVDEFLGTKPRPRWRRWMKYWLPGVALLLLVLAIVQCTADAPGPDRQPILLGAEPAALNRASHLILADGTFRDAPGFARVFLLFPPDAAPAARAAWRAHDGRDDITRAYFAQDEGRWVKKG